MSVYEIMARSIDLHATDFTALRKEFDRGRAERREAKQD